MPRLFVAINFPKEVTERLFTAAQHLRSHSLSSNVSRRENLHLTLAFIGETPNLKGAISALKGIDLPSFPLTLEGYGEFSSRDGHICFAKTASNPDLRKLADTVRKNLINCGLSIDTKLFKPHITLCRQFTPSKDFSAEDMEKLLCAETVTVSRISLMRSDRINGKLTYTEVYGKTL